MARRSRSAMTARRQQRNIDRAAESRRWNFVYCRCFICGGEYVVNNNSGGKIWVRKKRDHPLCFRCMYGNDWADEFILMYEWLQKQATEKPEGKAAKFFHKRIQQRPPQRLYRKRRSAPEV